MKIPEWRRKYIGHQADMVISHAQSIKNALESGDDNAGKYISEFSDDIERNVSNLREELEWVS